MDTMTINKNTLILFTALLFLTATASAQSVDTANHAEELLFVEYEVDPEFPGGLQALHKFFEDNMQYPQLAAENCIGGRVYVQFEVDTDGTVLNPKILRDIGGGCGEEALRVVGLMPKWKPGRFNGEVVKTTFLLPIFFDKEKHCKPLIERDPPEPRTKWWKRRHRN